MSSCTPLVLRRSGARFLSEQRRLHPEQSINIGAFAKAPRIALRLLWGIFGAVQYAHEHAVIHRGLKPSSILVKEDGGVWLLQRNVDTGSWKQQSGTFIVTSGMSH